VFLYPLSNHAHAIHAPCGMNYHTNRTNMLPGTHTVRPAHVLCNHTDGANDHTAAPSTPCDSRQSTQHPPSSTRQHPPPPPTPCRPLTRPDGLPTTQEHPAPQCTFCQSIHQAHVLPSIHPSCMPCATVYELAACMLHAWGLLCWRGWDAGAPCVLRCICRVCSRVLYPRSY
jgi:hypothetical protein